MNIRTSVVIGTLTGMLFTSPTLAANSIVSSDFSHTTNSVLFAKIERFFMWNTVRKAELTDAIANKLALTAVAESKTDPAAAALTLKKLDTETAELEKLTDLLRTSTDTRAKDTTDSIAADLATEAALFGDQASASTGEQATSLDSQQQETIQRLTALLAKESDKTRQAERVIAALDHYAKKDSTNSEKLLHKLELSARMKDLTDDPALEADLDEAENIEVNDHSALITQEEAQTIASALASKISNSQRLIVLTKLVDKLPEAARAVINTEIEKLTALLTANPDAQTNVEQALKNSEISTELQTKVLSKLGEHANAATQKQIETAKKAAETARETDKQAAEALKKEQEQATEAAKKAAEQSKEAESKSTNDSLENDSSSNVERETVEIKVKNGAFDGDKSFHFSAGTMVTVRFENEDDTARTLTLSNGTASTSVSNGSVSLTSFALTGTVTFTVSGVGSTGTIAVQ